MAISLLPSVSTSALLRLELINWVHTMGSLHICEDMCIHIHKRFCCCSVAKSCLTLCDSMNWSKPGFPVFNYLLEFAQTHVHWVDNAIQPSHPLLPPSPPALNLSQHQSFPMNWLFTSWLGNSKAKMGKGISYLSIITQTSLAMSHNLAISLQERKGNSGMLMLSHAIVI